MSSVARRYYERGRQALDSNDLETAQQTAEALSAQVRALESSAAAAEGDVDWGQAAAQFEGLPVWNPNALLATYRSLEALFPYYDFTDATIDRYEGPNGPVPVVAWHPASVMLSSADASIMRPQKPYSACTELDTSRRRCWRLPIAPATPA